MAVGVFLNRAFLLEFWRPEGRLFTGSAIAEVLIGVVGIPTAVLLFMARSKTPRKGVERQILLLLGLTAIFLSLAGMSLGIIESVTNVQMARQEYLLDSALSFVNIAASILFLLACITAGIATVILILNSYRILSRRQLIITTVISAIIFLALAWVSFVAITGFDLAGLMKIVAGIFSVISFVVTVATVFAIMAFGRGKGRKYWINLTLGLMITALSGLGSLLCIAVAFSWTGLPLLGFTAGVAFLGLAGYERWQQLKQQK